MTTIPKIHSTGRSRSSGSSSIIPSRRPFPKYFYSLIKIDTDETLQATATGGQLQADGHCDDSKNVHPFREGDAFLVLLLMMNFSRLVFIVILVDSHSHDEEMRRIIEDGRKEERCF